MENGNRKSVWPKVFAIGCGAILLFVVVIAGAVAWNWPRLTGLYHRASSAFSELMHVRAVVQDKYGGAVVVTVKRDGGTDGTVLSVTLANPSFLDQLDLDGPAAKEKALEVAAAARDALSPGSEYAAYEVVFSRQRDAGATVATTTSFRFQPKELPPRSRTPDPAR
jgi:hypothetical protein